MVKPDVRSNSVGPRAAEASGAHDVFRKRRDDAGYQEGHRRLRLRREPRGVGQDRGRGKDEEQGDRKVAVVEEESGKLANQAHRGLHAIFPRRAIDTAADDEASNTAINPTIAASP